MIIVDNLKDYLGMGRWCHMASDTSVTELNTFAESIGMSRDWFQDKFGHPHYDLTPWMRRRAILAGAKAVSEKEFVIAIRKWRDATNPAPPDATPAGGAKESE